ncbi:MAG: 3-deoxy-8-phosphooctulonate synthase [Phycisphaerales bacterium JB039]
MSRHCIVPGPSGAISIGAGQPLTIIAGPCTLESLELGLRVGAAVRDRCANLGLGDIFKASFDKANRTSAGSGRGPGMEQGLEWLAQVRESLAVPVTTDIHLPEQAMFAASIADMLQIPAFLCRQSDLLTAAAEAARARDGAMNIKKGQFLSPGEMAGPVRKCADAGFENLLLTERGTFFGYHRLVNDFIGLGDLMELQVRGGSPPVCFDITHSTQLPGAASQSGGRPERAGLLGRAATAAGAHALFLEVHPDPSHAVSDGATQLRIPAALELLESVARLRSAM